MSTDPSRTDIHALSGAYAVDALDEDERTAFEQHLAQCPSCQAEVDGLREAAATLADVNAVEPPAALRERVLADIATVRPLPPVRQIDAGVAPSHHVIPVRRRWAALVAAAAVVVVLAGAGIVGWHPWTSSSSNTQLSAVAQVQRAADARRFTTAGPGKAQVTVYRSVHLGKAVVVARHLPDPPTGKVYQLWLQDPAGAMHPAGFLPAGENSSATLSGAVGTARGAGVTVEPAGGSPVPTSNPVALVALTS